MRKITVESLLLIFLFGDLLQMMLSALLDITLPPAFSSALVLLVTLEGFARRQTAILLAGLFTFVVSLYATFIEAGSLGSIVATMRFFLFFTILTIIISSGQLASENTFSRLLVYVPLFLMAVSLIAGDVIFSVFGLNDIYAARGVPFADDVGMGWKTIMLGETISRLWVGFLAADKGGWFAGFVLTMLFSKLGKKTHSIQKQTIFLVAISPILIIQLMVVKAAFLFFSLLLFCRIFRSGTGCSIGVAYTVGYIVIFIAVMLILSLVPEAQLSSSGAISHVRGLVRPFELLLDNGGISAYFGFGPGLGGTLGEVGIDHSEMHKTTRGGESYVGALLFQYGFLGLPMILVGFITILLSYLKNRVIRIFFLNSLPVLFF